jgi:hypothetical protein
MSTPINPALNASFRNPGFIETLAFVSSNANGAADSAPAPKASARENESGQKRLFRGATSFAVARFSGCVHRV